MRTDNDFVFLRVREVKAPTRGTSKASGIDFYVPSLNNDLHRDILRKNQDISSVKKDCYEFIVEPYNKRILLGPGSRIIIPSGIKVRGLNNISLNAHNKSGVSTKKGLIYGAEVVDSDYTGEIHISIINTSNFIVAIHEDEKIVQFLQEFVNIGDIKEVYSSLELFVEESERGENWQGSTDNK